MFSKRRFLQSVTACATGFAVPGVFAQALEVTRLTTDGPFYPDKMPLDTDNDLLIINDKITPAVGEITHLTGRLLTASGAPIRNGFIEIWEADSTGSYIHTGGRNEGRIDLVAADGVGVGGRRRACRTLLVGGRAAGIDT
jgi:protocatechuate 3,4-dioxygenase beta subunit